MQRLLNVARDGRWLVVTSVLHEGRNLLLRFERLLQPSDGIPQAWLVSCQHVRQFSLTDFDGGGLNLWKRNHPLLSLFSSPKASLKVKIGDRSGAECAGLMLEAHRQAVDDWIDFDRFVPARAWAATSNSAPVVISGPKFLLEHYRRQLERAGFDAQLKKHVRALYWSGSRWSERRRAVSLLHFGTSFVVAESFTATPEALCHVRPNQRLQPSALGVTVKRRG